MFKIDNIGKQQEVLVSYDVYIPIDIKFGVWDTEQELTQYWRYGDFEHSLIEVGFGEETKELRSVTLVMCHNVSCIPANFPPLEQLLTGCPKVSLTNLGTNSYVDEKGFLSVRLHEKSLSILFDIAQPTSVIQNKEVEFLLNDSNKCIGLRIQNIDSHQMGILKDAFNL